MNKGRSARGRTRAAKPSSSHAPIPCDFWMVLQEMSPDFAMGSGFLCGFPQVLCGSDSADLGKRWRSKPFGLKSPAKPPRSRERGLRGFVLTALRLARFDDLRTSTLAFGFTVQNT